MKDAGSALMGIGYATGENRARRPPSARSRSPLIDTEITGARGILLSIAGGDDLSLYEVNEAAEVVREAATDDTNIIFGATIDERLDGPDLDHRRRDRARRRPRVGAGAARSSTAASAASGEVLEPPSFLRDAVARGRLDEVEHERRRGRRRARRDAPTVATRERPAADSRARASEVERRRSSRPRR